MLSWYLSVCHQYIFSLPTGTRCKTCPGRCTTRAACTASPPFESWTTGIRMSGYSWEGNRQQTVQELSRVVCLRIRRSRSRRGRRGYKFSLLKDVSLQLRYIDEQSPSARHNNQNIVVPNNAGAGLNIRLQEWRHFNTWPFATMKISPKMSPICQSSLSILPNKK